MKPCPRCGARLSIDKETDGTTVILCICCGYRRETCAVPVTSTEEVMKTYYEQQQAARDKKRQEKETRNRLIRELAADGWRTRELGRKFKLLSCSINQIIGRKDQHERKEKAACQTIPD
jgi:transcription elongation factor Elf1